MTFEAHEATAPASIEMLAGAMVMVGFHGLEPSQVVMRLVAERHAGGVILFSRNYHDVRQLRHLTLALRELAADPTDLLVAVDHEGGPVQRFGEPFTRIPPMARLGQSGDTALAHRLGRLMAHELADVGVNLDFAPVLDVDTNPDNPIIRERALSNRPEPVARLGAAIILGMQSRGVAACAKHFPGHGDTSVDSHLGLPVLHHDQARLRKVELAPFKRAVRIPVASVMMGHILVPAIDEVHPASLSRDAVTGLLRGELGYDGVVVTDDLEMKAVSERYSIEDVALLGLEAGIDLFLVCHTSDLQERLMDALIDAVERDRVPRERLEQSWRRLNALKTAYPPTLRSPDDPLRILSMPEHRRLTDLDMLGN